MSVIVVGAGPTGLTLAAELAGRGIAVRVLDRRPEPSPHSKAFGLLPRTLELLDLRGRADAFTARGLPWAHASLGDGRRWLSFRGQDTPFPYMLVIPQNRTEEELAAWATESGATVERGVAVTGLRQDETGVDVTLDDGRTERAAFVVGCDGVRSTVRDLAGIAFTGREYPSSLVVADVHVARQPDPAVYARTTKQGMVVLFPFGDGTYRMIALDHERMAAPVDEPVTDAELRRSARDILGDDFGLHSPLWTSRYRSAQRLSERYRMGRVLLAGDAAHTHIPSGGQGLQTGIQDAMNLGWKLAAHLNGDAPHGLLDTYQRERRPIARDTLRRTDLLYRFETSRSAPARLIRALSTRIAGIPALEDSVVKDMSGLTVRYPSAAGGWAGRRVPDTVVHTGKGPARLYEQFRSGRFVLLDQSPGGISADATRQGWDDRVDVVRATAPDRPRWPEALLIRPDGHAAWAGHAGQGPALRAALRQWVGKPT